MKAIQDVILSMGGRLSLERHRLLCMAIYEAWERKPETPQMKELWVEIQRKAHKKTAAAVSRALERAVAEFVGERGAKGDGQVSAQLGI